MLGATPRTTPTATLASAIRTALVLVAAAAVVVAEDQHGAVRNTVNTVTATTSKSVESPSALSPVNQKKDALSASAISSSGSNKTKALQSFQNSTGSSASHNDVRTDWSVPLALIDINLHKSHKATQQPKKSISKPPLTAFNYSDTSALARLLCGNLKPASDVDTCVSNLSYTPSAESDKLGLMCVGRTCRLACEIVHEENLLRVGRGRRGRGRGRRLAGASPCVFAEKPMCSLEQARSAFCALHDLDDHACSHVEQRKNYRLLCHNHHHNCTPLNKLCTDRGNNSESSTAPGKKTSLSVAGSGLVTKADKLGTFAEGVPEDRLAETEKTTSAKVSSSGSVSGDDQDNTEGYFSTTQKVKSTKPKSKVDATAIKADIAHMKVKSPLSKKSGKPLLSEASNIADDKSTPELSRGPKKAKREASVQDERQREGRESALPLSRASEESMTAAASTVASGERSPRSASETAFDEIDDDDARSTTIATLSHTSIFDLIGMYSSVGPKSPALLEHSPGIEDVTPSSPAHFPDDHEGATNGSAAGEALPSSRNDSDSGAKSIFNDFLSWLPIGLSEKNATESDDNLSERGKANETVYAQTLNFDDPLESDSTPSSRSSSGHQKEVFLNESGDVSIPPTADSFQLEAAVGGSHGSLVRPTPNYARFTADNSSANNETLDGSVLGKWGNGSVARNETAIAESYNSSVASIDATQGSFADLELLYPGGLSQNRTQTKLPEILTVGDSHSDPASLESFSNSSGLTNSSSSFNVSGSEPATAIPSDSSYATTSSSSSDPTTSKWSGLTTKSSPGKTFVKGGGFGDSDETEKPITMSVAPLLRERVLKDEEPTLQNATNATSKSSESSTISPSANSAPIFLEESAQTDGNSYTSRVEFPDLHPDSEPLSTASTPSEASVGVGIENSTFNLPTTTTATPVTNAGVQVAYLIPFSPEEDLGVDVPDGGEQEQGAVTAIGLDQLASFATARTEMRAEEASSTPSTTATSPAGETVHENGTESSSTVQSEGGFSALAFNPENSGLPYNASATAVPRKLPGDNETALPINVAQGGTSTTGETPKLGTTPFPNVHSLGTDSGVAGMLDSVDLRALSEEQNEKNASSDLTSVTSSGGLQELTGGNKTPPDNSTKANTANKEDTLEPNTSLPEAPSQHPNGNVTANVNEPVLQPSLKPGDERNSGVEPMGSSATEETEFLQRFGQLCHLNYAQMLEFSACNATTNKEWIAFLIQSLNKLLQEQS